MANDKMPDILLVCCVEFALHKQHISYADSRAYNTVSESLPFMMAFVKRENCCSLQFGRIWVIMEDIKRRKLWNFRFEEPRRRIWTIL